MKTVNWGIIGCGNVTEVKSGPAFNLVENSRLAAVMRRNAKLAEDYAKRHKVPTWYSSADDLINDEEVNAIYIATPPDSHAGLSIRAMKAGKPVYVEKPMALDHEQCRKMLEVSEETGVPLFVAYYRRALPGFLKVKDLIDSGTIGAVKLVNLQLYRSVSPDERSGILPWRVIPEISGGGHFFDLASHQLDYLDFLLGPVEKVRSVALNQAALYKAEDMVSASFVFPGEVVATGSWCFTAPEFLERDIIEIIGEKGSIVFSCFDFTPIELHTSEGRQTFDFPKPDHVQYYLIRQVVEELTGMGKANSNAVSGARTSRVMDEVVREFRGR
ncbi:MAG: Gfo/Idh/MocA family protein [Bacteroidota bacterium]